MTLSNGGGYPTTIDGKSFAVTITASGVSYAVNILSCCSSNTMQLEIPAAATGTSLTISLKGPVNTVTKTYSVQSSLTPTATITTNNLNIGSNTITFTASNDVSATINSIKLVSTINSAIYIDVASNTWTTTGSGNGATTTFTETLNSGSYNIQADTGNGYIDFGTSTLNVQLPTSLSLSTQQISFNGGSVTIPGNNLSPASYVTVNGFKGMITSYSSSSVTYKVPAFVNPTTQSTFSLS